MRFAAALLAIGSTLIAAACGGASTKPSAMASETSAELAFAHCMRSHGVPSFPDPDAQGDFPPFHTGVSKPVSSAANEMCKRLLPTTGGGTATLGQQRKKLEFGVKVAECMRTHGFPDLPDPSHLGSNTLPSDIDQSSPRFQSAEAACEQQARKALRLP